MRVFTRNFRGDLDEKEIQKEGQEILLFSVPSQNLSAKQILWCRNAEVRSLLLQRIGNERLLVELNGWIIHSEGDSQLIGFDPKHLPIPYRIIRVRDSTTGQYYLLRVPPTVSTCHEAIAWTFGLRPEHYSPIKET